ncbi:hypothetical protein C8T65DRAFT_813958 [Cerioporus squamosus]|nr:hypothetical protein C8T65DRAFT_813958 [Cerioporus squamosus]
MMKAPCQNPARSDRFLSWLSGNCVQLEPGISIVENEAGIAVYSTAACNQSDSVAVVPKSAVLSVRTCVLSEQISWVPYGHGAVLALSLALYSEILNGAQSRWFGYLQSLPSNVVPIARLWGHPAAFPDEADAREACSWIRGTEVERELQDDDGGSLLTEIDDFYQSDVEPLLTSRALRPSLSGFLHAYSLVCSRAFLVDAYHGLSMVPVADAFNHSQNNHVQLASEYDVCPDCGSLAECPHDREDSSDRSRPGELAEDGTDTVDMVAVRPIAAGVEIFNTYGAHLGNAALLARYGFLLDDCDTDTVTFGWKGSGLVVEDQDDDWIVVYRLVAADLGPLAEVSPSLYQPGDDRRGALLSINSDGQASLGLFVRVVRNIALQRPSSRLPEPHLQLHGLPRSTVRDAISGLITRTFSVLLQVEVRGTIDDDEDADPITDAVALHVLDRTARSISNMCRARLERMGQPGDSAPRSQELGRLLDDIPPEKFKTRCALNYLISERAILETCTAHWEALRDPIGEVSTSGLDDEIIDD